MEEGGNAADGSSEGEEGDSVEEEDDKEKLKGDKTGSKRKKTASSKVASCRQRSAKRVCARYAACFRFEQERSSAVPQ